MKKISSTLTYIVSVILLSSLIYIIIFLFILNNAGKDAMIVNYSGILRGGIQRIVKLELQNEGDDKLIEEIDNKINEVKDFRKNISIFSRDRKKFESEVLYISNNWYYIKDLIKNYREIHDKKTGENILQQSEILWEECNSLVFLVQNFQKIKFFYFTLFYL